MKFFIKKNDIMFAGIIFFVFCVAGGILILAGGGISFGVLLFVALVGSAIIALQFEIYRRLGEQYRYLHNDIRQSMALSQIISAVSPKRPLPQMRGWAISPDIGFVLISKIFEKEPECVVECGSGVSTILAAYCFQKIGKGKVLSLEHEKEWAETTKRQLKQHGLEKFAQVVFAPLVNQHFGDHTYYWYDKNAIPEIKKIDILFVDGPPSHIKGTSRYPALQFFYKKLSDSAVVLLDDAVRKTEQVVLKKWKKEFPDMEIEMLNVEKGAALLTRK